MKKILIIAALLLSYGSTIACDICGCGAGTYYVGLLPQFTKRFVGIRYQYSEITTQLGPNGERTTLTSDERYRNMDIWGAWNIGDRFRVMAILPYSFNEKYNAASDELRKKNGIGDIVVNGYYKILEKTGSTDRKLINQSLWAGVGIKFATGKYDTFERLNAQGNSPNIFQLGTGSTDILLNAIYDIRISDFGINANVSGKINMENSDDYHYGNKLSGNISAYHKFSLGQDRRISPTLGVAAETQMKDKTMGFVVDETGGKLVQGIVGVELTLNKVSFGINYQVPLAQKLALGRMDAGNKAFAHLSFAF
ncbi:transporter [Sphingobacteriaceae bacterium WQ 2009]|uniref:Transporter n=1 Tax=Rhinopithecimicrobium faecis TaxID=2820698 RepID=A0A8T4H9J8_9SPHI|nr:transporter [Sphingobacteriaceae bacterium WQ 2009]